MVAEKRDVHQSLPKVKGVPILETIEGKVIQATQSEGKLELILSGHKDKMLVTLTSDAPPRVDVDEHVRVHYEALIKYSDVLSIANARAIEILEGKYSDVVKFAYVTKGYMFNEPKKA